MHHSFIPESRSMIIEEILRQMQKRAAGRLEIPSMRGVSQARSHFGRRQGILRKLALALLTFSLCSCSPALVSFWP
jgi:hypothetical protein